MTSYMNSLDVPAMLAEHPIGTDFEQFAKTISRDELFARQDALFRRCLSRAWQTGFYQRLWGREGIEPGDVTGLADIDQLPVFDKSHLMESIDLAPPFGDFAGVDPKDPNHPPAVFHTTSGTTGKPQVLLFGAKSREVQNLLLGRLYRLQGLVGSDVVHSVYGHGMINGGHYSREAVVHWTNAVFMSAGTGIETRSTAQVQLMRDFGATVIVGFADYLKRLAEAAEAEGIVIGRDINIRMISGQMGREDKDLISRLWGGAECYDWYGVGDTGIIAAEGSDNDGLYIWEDAHLVEILDRETLASLDDGETGNICVTTLFKNTIYPIIRFNTNDVCAVLPGRGGIGVNFRRLAGFQGRSDNMVKLRGINVYPTGIGAILNQIDNLNGEYVCRLVNQEGRDELIVMAEQRAEANIDEAQVAELLRQRLGVAVLIDLVGPGETARLSQVDSRQKPIRLIDER